MSVLTKDEIAKLIKQAMGARTKAYAPYSNFAVGAALMSKQGRVYPGCNIENSSFGATVCAERVAFYRAVQEGEREFQAIAIVGGPKDKPVQNPAFPCGICRQVMQEFASGDFLIIAAIDEENYECHCLGELLPCAFGGEMI